MKKLWNRFLLYAEIYSYMRVLKECPDLLTDEHKQNIQKSLEIARKRAA